MLHPTPLPPSSSSASAPPFELRPEPSRVLAAWWWLLHALLVGIIAISGSLIALKWLGVAAVVAHGVLLRPLPPPALVIVREGGACAIPEWGPGLRPLGPRTTVAPFWVRLDLGSGNRQRELLLIADQVGPADWRRLRALLARARGE